MNIQLEQGANLGKKKGKYIMCYKKEFEDFASQKAYINVNHELVGKIAIFKNGYGIQMNQEVLGVDPINNEIYVNWDCFWLPVNITTREVIFN